MSLKSRVERLEREMRKDDRVPKLYLVEFIVGGTYTIDGSLKLTEEEFFAWEKTVDDRDKLVMVDLAKDK